MLRVTFLLVCLGCRPGSTDPETGLPTDGPTQSDTHSEDTGALPTVRIVTWNVQSLGATDSEQFGAARDVLRRLDGDVVGLQEVDEAESDALAALAADLGYLHVQLGRETPFGTLRNAILTRLTPDTLQSWPARDLSSDGSAEDVTRQPVSSTVETPWGEPITVVVQHCKSGFDDIDEFRRTVDALRTASVSSGATVLVGDINEDPREDPELPERFTREPSGAPSDFRLGTDVEAVLRGAGLLNDPFAAFAAAGFHPVDAAQPDGRVETRDSGRWIDHVLPDESIQVVGVEIYDSRDEARSRLAMAGAPLARHLVRAASDHLPVLADVTRR